MDRTIILGGRFALVRELGSGGNATVWLADDLRQPGVRVAVKVLHPHLVSIERAIERFTREAAILSALDHVHIARALDFGFDGDLAFIAFEWVQGTTLQLELERRSRDNRPFELAEIESIGRAIAGALDYAHQQGVVHRDLKPANLILGPAGPKIVDFGIAKIIRGEDEATTVGRLLGSMLYMAPEQTEGMPADARADVFAFACVLFELLTLHRTWARNTDGTPLPSHQRRTGVLNSVARVLERIRTDARPAPSVLRAGLSNELDRVIAKALAVSPAERYSSAGEFFTAFARALRSGTRDASIEQRLRVPAVTVLSIASVALGFLVAGAQTPVIRAVLPAPSERELETPAPNALVILGPGEIEVPEGAFTAGCAPSDTRCADDERPGRTVILPRFAIDRSEVTVREYRECLAVEACSAPGRGPKCNADLPGREDHPVNCVDAQQAAAFCRFVGKRLPSSEEWEKAARGDDARIYPWGDQSPSCARANFGGCGGETIAVTSTIGASAYGALAMAGNVWEWTASRRKNGRRIVRGGSFFDVEGTLRASNRGSADPAMRAEEIGVRCARSL